MNERAQDFQDEFIDEPPPGPRRSRAGAAPGTNAGGRPEIEIRIGEMERAVDETQEALIAAQPTWPVEKKLFRRGDRLVSLAINEGKDHKGGKVEHQIIVEVGEHTIAERMAVAATYQKWDARKKGGGGLKQVDPPKDLVKTLIGRGHGLRLPLLIGVVNCPQMAADGRILDKPGYDPGTGIFYDPRGAQFPAIVANPRQADAEMARDRLLRLYHTFDFQSENDRAVALSLVMTRLARIGMATAPLHAYDAPTAGSGKSMVVDIASILATGERAAVFAQGSTLEEFEKRLSVQLMMGRQIIAIDNITQELDGDLLNQSLTQDRVDLRILGESRAVTAQCPAVTAATGNNLRLVGDLTRRSLVARLDPKTDRPELRQFDYHPLTDARENRGELVAAALTILRAYCVAGMPGQPAKLQNFEDWSNLVRGALIWVGLGDPAATQERLRENDPKLAKLIRMATVWNKAFGEDRTTVAEAVVRAEAKERVGTYEDSKFELANPDLNDAFMAVARRGAAINPPALGTYLGSEAERVVVLENGAKVRFERGGVKDGSVRWTLVTVEPASVKKSADSGGDRGEVEFSMRM
jgi:putative DNA primase/helicase